MYQIELKTEYRIAYLKVRKKAKIRNRYNEVPYLTQDTTSGFYTKLIVWGSLGLKFEYDGGPIIEIGGPIFLYKFPEDRKNSL